MKLTRDAILKAGAKLASEKVEVPEWGGTVTVVELTGRERDAWEADIVELNEAGDDAKMSLENARAKLAVRTVVDDDGKRIFTDDDIEELGSTSARALSRIFNVASRLSGLTPGDMDELTKN